MFVIVTFFCDIFPYHSCVNNNLSVKQRSSHSIFCNAIAGIIVPSVFSNFSCETLDFIVDSFDVLLSTFTAKTSITIPLVD